MPLAQNEIEALIDFIPDALSDEATFRGVVDAANLKAWNKVVPQNATYSNAVRAVVREANAQGWLGTLLSALLAQLPKRPGGWTELERWIALVNRPVTSTTKNPFDEVLLRGDRPFANRRGLRNQLQELAAPDGACVLLVDGERETGKSFSVELLRHAAPKSGGEVLLFKVEETPTLVELAEDILGRVRGDSAAFTPIAPMAAEGPDRWARNIVNQVAAAIRAQGKLRFLVFDYFPEGVPNETLRFISRLARFAEEDLPDLLRVVLVRFPGDLDPSGFPLRDVAQPFFATDMVQVVMQAAAARTWAVSEAVVKTRIDAFLTDNRKSPRQCFDFLAAFIVEIKSASPSGA